MDFIFTSLQKIHTDRDSTATSLAKELAKSHRVLYINPPIDTRTYYAKNNDAYTKAHIEGIKHKAPSLSKTENLNLWTLNPATLLHSINWIPNTSLFSFFNKHNNKKLAKDIAEAVESIGLKDFILINDKDIFRSYYLKELLRPKQYVYLDRDYTVGMQYWRRHGLELEPKLMQKADTVVCNSSDFTLRAREYNANSHYIGNGFDVSQYNFSEKLAAPEDLKNIPSPIIGYIGALITMRLDLNLMIALAAARPQWSFVLIGWEDEKFSNSKLHYLPNVHFLGKKHTREIPAYIQNFDVCLNPQVINEITKGNFPLKVVEYLALGKPVIATPTNTMKEVFGDHTYLATGTDGYIESIQTALDDNSHELEQERLQFASSFTWQKVAGLLLDAISNKSKNTTKRESVIDQ